MNRTTKRVAALGTATIAVAGAGIAFAAWTASGGGTGYAKAGTAQLLTTTDVSAGASADLYPGGTTGLRLSIHNPNSYSVAVTSVQPVLDATHFVVGTGGLGTCTDAGATPAHPTGVSFLGWTSAADGGGVPITAAPGDTVVTLASKVSMTNSSDNNCQGATFAIPVSISGASS